MKSFEITGERKDEAFAFIVSMFSAKPDEMDRICELAARIFGVKIFQQK